MSTATTVPIVDDFHLETTNTWTFVHTSESFRFTATQVFLPLELDPSSTYSPVDDDNLFVRAVHAAAHAFSVHADGNSEAQWDRITRMLDNLQAHTHAWGWNRGCVVSQLRGMQTGDILAFRIQHTNSAIVLTRRETCALFESFELSPSRYAIDSITGSLICSYPASAAEIQNETFDNGIFQLELADFICAPQPVEDWQASPCLGTHEEYITALLSGILEDANHTADIPLITKRIRDKASVRWDRSTLWLLIRVAIQMSLDRSSLGRASYKAFMLFFLCTIAKDPKITILSPDMLHLIGSKILRRLAKLGSSAHDWLSQLALKTCTDLREILDARWETLSTRPFSFRNPSQEELRRDTHLPHWYSHEYISNALANHGHDGFGSSPLHPTHLHNGTDDNFLDWHENFSNVPEYPNISLYDTEQFAERSLDDQVTFVTDADETCLQLMELLDKYMRRYKLVHGVQCRTYDNPEDESIMGLTGVEFFVAIDKLVVQKIPMLADYSPEIPVHLLEGLLLHTTTSLNRLCRVLQYLSVRHSRSRPGWSVFSDEFTENSFPVRYYDQSPQHQQLKARIEQETTYGGVYQSPLPSEPSQAKVVVFELQCPLCIRIWRSAVAQIISYFYSFSPNAKDNTVDLLARVPALRPYYVAHDTTSQFFIEVAIGYFSPEGSQPGSPTTELRYAFRYGFSYSTDYLRNWRGEKQVVLFSYVQDAPVGGCSSCATLREYVNYTSHTSNDLLATQANCPTDLSLDEFIAFGHLRSGGSLQWASILQGLRSRTLNLRHCHIHHLLSAAAFQVGPFDSNTATWVWHQDLQEPSFCNALLDELDGLLADAGALIDGMTMRSISLLLTRVLASSPSEGVSERTLALLRKVRRKTFNWVQELSYNLAMTPMNKERSDLLLDMALTCRSTFDVDSTIISKLICSAEDVGALVSCSLFIQALKPERLGLRPRLFLLRDHRLSVFLEEVLEDVILADVSNYGVDVAVLSIFPSYKPSTHRWEAVEHQNARWLTCQTEAMVGYSLQTVHLNLLDGMLQVDGKPIGGLPCSIRNDPELRHVFRDQGFFVIPSDLPGMDLTTLAMTPKYKVHFSLRGFTTVVRAQCSQSNNILELIRSISGLKEDLPPALVNGYVHWLNLETGIIEIRPLDRIWEPSPDDWRIDCASGRYRIRKGRETLVNVRSPTWAMVSKCFECLGPVDTPMGSNNLIITTSSIESLDSMPVLRLSVTLSNYGLSFFVNQRGEFESHEFKDMVYDENQCVGALLGLEDIFVLRQKDSLIEELIPRCILVPNGIPKRHVTIGLRECSTTGEPPYHTYHVDTELGCLMGTGSLISTQDLASLHLNTSYDRPDPLTGKTGVQSALCLLRSAAHRSVMKLKALSLGRYGISTYQISRYPQINMAVEEVRSRYYWNRGRYGFRVVRELEKRAAHAASYLFPWHPISPTSPKNRKHPDRSYFLTIRAPTEPGPRGLRYISNEKTSWNITLDQLLFHRPAPELPSRSTLRRNSHEEPSGDITKLNKLFTALSMDESAPSTYQREYIDHLEKSAQHVREDSRVVYTLPGKDRINILETHYTRCRVSFLDALQMLKESLGPTVDPREQALEKYGQWPPATADVLLRYLASTSPIQLSAQWEKCLISLALLLLDVQRARRLLRFALDGLEEEFLKELENEGCDGWDPGHYPDWMLIQIQGNFLIRRTQAEIAMEMISPKSGQNTVLQVNIGEGKSSVIIPIVAAALANGKQLARVIVPKALTAQMFELLVSRLGGLANRPIYHLPFSRSPDYSSWDNVISVQLEDLQRLMPQCMAERGVLLVQPEHVVSLKLMCVEAQIPEGKAVANPSSILQGSHDERVTTSLLLKALPEDSFVGNMFHQLGQSADSSTRTDAAQADQLGAQNWDARGSRDSASKWLNLQGWIDSHIRDILDESDEILHPRFQLIYTIGAEQHMDGCPDRWTITQQVLRLAKECAHTLSKDYPNSMEYECESPGSFPHLGIVGSSDIGRLLVSMIVEDVLAGRLPSLNFPDISPELRDAIRSFISDKDVLQVPDAVKKVKEYAQRSDQSHTWSGLLLLRGLLASNILLFALTERRWRIDYGLILQKRDLGPPLINPTWNIDYAPSQERIWDSAHTKLAVPYRAKDVPVLNTQFGQPDMIIILTCLSYYYSGLSEEQLRSSFEILLDGDNPSIEYARWVKDYDDTTVQESLLSLGGINLKSSEQWDKMIFPLFSRNQAAVDFYLSRVVFPKEAKEFPSKLSASSWDLAETREKVITGFSGTNDSRWLLPTSISQQDLDHQQGTNARVLTYLLQPENDAYIPIHQNGERESTHQILDLVAKQRPEIRVLVDVGAQILDLSNYQVATAWLDIARDAPGAIYFNGNDELIVLMRNGASVPMSSSPVSQQLDRCVVYLDHAHTRGTDIKLPVGSRAAVVLGPKLTKDRLVQGCMRMRKLGHGHSVMFLAPPEVDLNIRALTGKQDANAQITTVDILCWAIHETWADIQQRAPHWAQQGVDHKLRYDAWSRFRNNELTSEHLSDAWLSSEVQSLEDLYAPCETKNDAGPLPTVLDLGIHQRCQDLGILSLPRTRMDEEQERELHTEREHERVVTLPRRAIPGDHLLHPDVVAFVKTGVVPPLLPGGGFRPVFTALEKETAATREAGVWSPFILATADFCHTVHPESTHGSMDKYLRPVRWVLSSERPNGGHVLVVVSPFEADRLMPDIRAGDHVHLHVYAPRMSQRMRPSDDLSLYSIPPLHSDWVPDWELIDQLNIFAGQLYLRDYPSYLRLCHFLRVPTEELPNETGVQPNLSNISAGSEESEITSSDSPLPSVKALLAIRSRDRPFAHTHMGKILEGKSLRRKDFDEQPTVVSGSSTVIH